MATQLHNSSAQSYGACCNLTIQAQYCEPSVNPPDARLCHPAPQAGLGSLSLITVRPADRESWIVCCLLVAWPVRSLGLCRLPRRCRASMSSSYSHLLFCVAACGTDTSRTCCLCRAVSAAVAFPQTSRGPGHGLSTPTVTAPGRV